MLRASWVACRADLCECGRSWVSQTQTVNVPLAVVKLKATALLGKGAKNIDVRGRLHCALDLYRWKDRVQTRSTKSATQRLVDLCVIPKLIVVENDFLGPSRATPPHTLKKQTRMLILSSCLCPLCRQRGITRRGSPQNIVCHVGIIYWNAVLEALAPAKSELRTLLPTPFESSSPAWLAAH